MKDEAFRPFLSFRTFLGMLVLPFFSSREQKAVRTTLEACSIPGFRISLQRCEGIADFWLRSGARYGERQQDASLPALAMPTVVVFPLFTSTCPAQFLAKSWKPELMLMLNSVYEAD